MFYDEKVGDKAYVLKSMKGIGRYRKDPFEDCRYVEYEIIEKFTEQQYIPPDPYSRSGGDYTRTNYYLRLKDKDGNVVTLNADCAHEKDHSIREYRKPGWMEEPGTLVDLIMLSHHRGVPYIFSGMVNKEEFLRELKSD